MLQFPIDVCFVTKNSGSKLSGLEYLPVNHLIVETSKPLALARMRAIQKVTTEWFAFIDDDVRIGPDWYKQVSTRVMPRVGAVCGRMTERGLGVSWDKAVNEQTGRIRQVTELRRGERGYTHNTLLRTALVRDWMPSRDDLEAYEDYEIAQHVLSKGFRWLVVPDVNAWHEKTWMRVWHNVIWGVEHQAKITSTRRILRQFLRTLFQIPHVLLAPNLNLRVKVYSIFRKLALLWGTIRALR
ncbi:MAG: glycosyltransferase [Candidatus Bathyarchaeota archaeon]|nr:glycosyltransferase [Candidatus Bathyarchaeota archaeon]